MPILDLDSISSKDSIGIKEIIRRLKANPNDLGAQNQLSSFKKEFKEMSAKMQVEIDDLLDTPVATIKLVKKLSSPEYRHRVELIEGINLISRIPKTGKKHKVARKISKLFLNNLKVDKFEIIKCINPTIFGYTRKSKRLTKNDYIRGKNKYDKQIKNRFKYLNKVANELGHTFKSHKQYVVAERLPSGS